jgi:hypothetical protein
MRSVSAFRTRFVPARVVARLAHAHVHYFLFLL